MFPKMGLAYSAPAGVKSVSLLFDPLSLFSYAPFTTAIVELLALIRACHLPFSCWSWLATVLSCPISKAAITFLFTFSIDYLYSLSSFTKLK